MPLSSLLKLDGGTAQSPFLMNAYLRFWFRFVDPRITWMTLNKTLHAMIAIFDGSVDSVIAGGLAKFPIHFIKVDMIVQQDSSV